jgi:folate-binding protein YgfZ
MPDSAIAPAGALEVDREYAILQHGALVVDRSTRSRWRFTGPRARETIAGLVTNDVAALEPGRGCYAAVLTPKGKILADVRIFALRDGVLVDASLRAAPGWTDVVRKYVNPRVTPYDDVSQTISDIGVFGPTAPSVVRAALAMGGDAMLPSVSYAHQEYADRGTPITIASVPDAGEGLEIFLPTHAAPDLIERIHQAGGVVGNLSALDITRVELGRPEWGADMDEGTIPQEANFDELDAISYTKGCYTGQETVARIHFRGHVNRHLRGLRLAAGGPMPPLRAGLIDAAGAPVGDVRSVVQSPRYGLIALAMIRREVEVGAAVTARWEAINDQPAGETRATVEALPFSEADH